MKSMIPTFHHIDQVDDCKIKYAVVAARYQDKWVFCRHKQRSTWELPGGHREPGEAILDTAKRELYEETGATEFDLHVVGVYKLHDYGLLAYANIKKISNIPADSEIGETGLFELIPTSLTYADAHYQLFDWVQGWLNLQSNADELWDVYDSNRQPTGRLHRRGDYMQEGDHHLVVTVWMRNSDGMFLLTKRSPLKGFPHMWETTAGSALAGDDSLTAALREVREETGLVLDVKKGRCVLKQQYSDHFNDIWLFQQDFSLDDVVLLPGETCDVMYADKDTIRRLDAEGRLVPYDYLEEILQMA